MDSQAQGALTGAGSGALIGAQAGGPYGALAGLIIGGAAGYLGAPKRPKYNVRPETDENKALAATSAFGVSPAVRQGIAQAEQDAAESVNNAQNYSANTSSILNVLRSVNAQKNQTIRGYMGDNAQIQQAGRNQLIGTNQAAIDEQDKAWNFNVNQPYQNQVATNREFQRGAMENYWRYLDMSRARNIYNSAGASD